MGLIYKKISLFDSPKGANILHSCNAQGVWGAGIASEFKRRYPKAYKDYQDFCKQENIVGDFFTADNSYWNSASTTPQEQHYVCGLITSNGYGQDKDHKDVIKINTAIALDRFLSATFLPHEDCVIYSNKFNSGFFGVPWSETELILKVVLEKYPNVNWIVCDKHHEE